VGRDVSRGFNADKVLGVEDLSGVETKYTETSNKFFFISQILIH